MFKRLMLLLGIVVALAAAAAPLASAAPALTFPPGVLVPVGTKLTMTSFNLTAVTVYGQFGCGTITIPLIVSENNGSSATLLATGGLALPECIFGSPEKLLKVPMTDLTMPKIVFKTGSTGTTAMTFEADYTPILTTCHYSSEAVPFTYVAGTSSFRITNGMLTQKGPFRCVEGAKVNAEFSLKTTSGVPVTID